MIDYSCMLYTNKNNKNSFLFSVFMVFCYLKNYAQSKAVIQGRKSINRKPQH